MRFYNFIFCSCFLFFVIFSCFFFVFYIPSYIHCVPVLCIFVVFFFIFILFVWSCSIILHWILLLIDEIIDISLLINKNKNTTKMYININNIIRKQKLNIGLRLKQTVINIIIYLILFFRIIFYNLSYFTFFSYYFCFCCFPFSALNQCKKYCLFCLFFVRFDVVCNLLFLFYVLRVCLIKSRTSVVNMYSKNKNKSLDDTEQKKLKIYIHSNKKNIMLLALELK